MGRKQKKKATQKEISQKTCAAANEEDETGTDCCSCDSFSCSSKVCKSSTFFLFDFSRFVLREMISTASLSL